MLTSTKLDKQASRKVSLMTRDEGKAGVDGTADPPAASEDDSEKDNQSLLHVPNNYLVTIEQNKH